MATTLLAIALAAYTAGDIMLGAILLGVVILLIFAIWGRWHP